MAVQPQLAVSAQDTGIEDGQVSGEVDVSPSR